MAERYISTRLLAHWVANKTSYSKFSMATTHWDKITDGAANDPNRLKNWAVAKVSVTALRRGTLLTNYFGAVLTFVERDPKSSSATDNRAFLDILS